MIPLGRKPLMNALLYMCVVGHGNVCTCTHKYKDTGIEMGTTLFTGMAAGARGSKETRSKGRHSQDSFSFYS